MSFTSTGSTLSHLECTFTGETYPADKLINVSAAGKVLYPRYDLSAAKKRLIKAALKDRPPNLWRYKEVLPVLWEENVVSLGEGLTPLLDLSRLAERRALPPPGWRECQISKFETKQQLVDKA